MVVAQGLKVTSQKVRGFKPKHHQAATLVSFSKASWLTLHSDPDLPTSCTERGVLLGYKEHVTNKGFLILLLSMPQVQNQPQIHLEVSDSGPPLWQSLLD